LKIAFSTLSYYGKEPHEDVKASIEATAKLCRELGHEIIEVTTPVSGQEFLDAFLTVWASTPVQLVQLAINLKRKPEDVLEPWTIGLAEFFGKKPKDALAKSLAYFKTVEAAMDVFFSHYDAWLTPVLSSTPRKLGEQAPTVPFDTLYERITSYVAYTPIHNVAGTPAMSDRWAGPRMAFRSAASSPLPRAMMAYSTPWPMSWNRRDRGPQSTAWFGRDDKCSK